MTPMFFIYKDTKSREQNKRKVFLLYAETQYLRLKRQSYKKNEANPNFPEVFLLSFSRKDLQSDK